MNCEKFRDSLSAGLDSELSTEEQRRLEDHLSKCGSCREQQLAYERVAEIVSSTHTGAAAPALWGRIAAEAERRGAARTARERRLRLLVGPLAAAAGFLIYVLLFIGIADRAPEDGDIARAPAQGPADGVVSAELILSQVRPLLGDRWMDEVTGQFVLDRPENQFVMALVQEVNK